MTAIESGREGSLSPAMASLHTVARIVDHRGDNQGMMHARNTLGCRFPGISEGEEAGPRTVSAAHAMRGDMIPDEGSESGPCPLGSFLGRLKYLIAKSCTEEPVDEGFVGVLTGSACTNHLGGQYFLGPGSTQIPVEPPDESIRLRRIG